MKPSEDLAIVRSKSKAFQRLGRQFHEVLVRYAEEEGQKDFIWRYSERTLVGALAAAVWLSGGVALEEYGGKKQKANRSNGHGRTDLYFKLDDRKYICEAKHRYIELGKIEGDWSGKLTTKCLYDARKNQIHQKEMAVGISFWSVRVNKKELKKAEKLSELIKKLDEIVEKLKTDDDSLLSTCYFPGWALNPAIDHGEGNRHYIGVVMRVVEV